MFDKSLLRYVFFEKEESVTSNSEEKFKDDCRQLRAIVTTLQLPHTTKLEMFMADFVLDVNKIPRGKDRYRQDSSLSSNDGLISEEGENEEYLSEDNLTDPY